MEGITRLLKIIMVITFTLFALFDGKVRTLVVLGVMSILLYQQLIEMEIVKIK